MQLCLSNGMASVKCHCQGLWRSERLFQNVSQSLVSRFHHKHSIEVYSFGSRLDSSCSRHALTSSTCDIFKGFSRADCDANAHHALSRVNHTLLGCTTLELTPSIEFLELETPQSCSYISSPRSVLTLTFSKVTHIVRSVTRESILWFALSLE